MKTSNISSVEPLEGGVLQHVALLDEQSRAAFTLGDGRSQGETADAWEKSWREKMVLGNSSVLRRDYGANRFPS